MSENESSSGLSRRTVVKAAAWSVPIMAIGAPAHAQTSSGIFQLTGLGCKLPGNSNDVYKGYAFGVTLTNNNTVAIQVTIESLTLNTTDLGDVLLIQTNPADASVCSVIGTNVFNLAAGEIKEDVIAVTENAASSANGTLTVTYTVVPTSVSGGVASATVDAAPPINGGSCRDFTPAQKECLRSLEGAPTITSIDPTSGPVGTGVTITGTNFLGTSAVTFDGVSSAFSVVSGTEIATTVPAGVSTGSITVEVTAAGTASIGFEVITV